MSTTMAEQASPPFAEATCLCGSIRLTLTQAPASRFICHCTSCRKSTGSLCGSTWLVPRSSLTFHSKSTLTSYTTTATVTGTAVTRNFCSVCGSNIFAESVLAGDSVAVFSGIVDGKEGTEWMPDVEWFVERKVQCLKVLEVGSAVKEPGELGEGGA